MPSAPPVPPGPAGAAAAARSVSAGADSSEPAGPLAPAAASASRGSTWVVPSASGPPSFSSATGAGASPPASSAVSMMAISALFGTVAPSSARISLRTPSNGDGTSALTLSVMTSSSGSYFATVSPGCLSHFPIVPSATLSPSWGIVTFATFAAPSDRLVALAGTRVVSSITAMRVESAVRDGQRA